MDSYQAVYEAVRSRFSSFNADRLVSEIASRFEFSHHMDIIRQEFVNTAFEQQRPAVLFCPKIYMDGDKWCALYGDNMQDGVAGFGDSPDEAMRDFDKNWTKKRGE